VTTEHALTDLEDVAGRTLDLAREAGASMAEAAIGSGRGLSVTVRLGEVERVEHDSDHGLAVTVYFGQCKGTASTSDLSDRAVRDTVLAACAIARHTAPDPCNGLADPADMARAIPDLDLYHPWDPAPEEAIELARTCEQAALAVDPRIRNSEGASLASHEGQRVYANSHGFVGAWRSTRHSLSCAVLAHSDSGMERDHWYSVARRADGLEAPDTIGRTAGQRALRRLGARKLETRTAPVVFAAEIAGGLIGHFIGAIRGGALYRRASFLLDHLGQAIFPPGFRIREEPHIPGGMGSAPFDGEGVATRARDLVSDGVLLGYLLDSYSARRLGLRTTGNAGGVHNLVVTPGTLEQAELLREMGSGLLVTGLMGMGVNGVTGDYSRGATGFWVEDGAIAYPVHEITIAGNLKTMFMDIRQVGRDVDTRGNIRTGSILLERMTVAGS
jgi:PmbA protein